MPFRFRGKFQISPKNNNTLTNQTCRGKFFILFYFKKLAYYLFHWILLVQYVVRSSMIGVPTLSQKRKMTLLLAGRDSEPHRHSESTPEVFHRKCRRHVCGPCWSCEHRRLLFSNIGWLTSASVAYVVWVNATHWSLIPTPPPPPLFT